MDILESLLNSSSHAIFALDEEGIVTHINAKAKEQFGLFNHSPLSHEAGRLCPGDVVILLTTAMGDDDGGLQAEDLGVLGIHDKKLQPGDMLAAVGVYQDPQGEKPVYKFLRRRDADALHLDTVWGGRDIHVAIADHDASITVGDTVYAISYFISICQCVILDAQTGKVKFWEEKGYSARKEGVGNLLRGGSFGAKVPRGEMEVVGYYFREF